MSTSLNQCFLVLLLSSPYFIFTVNVSFDYVLCLFSPGSSMMNMLLSNEALCIAVHTTKCLSFLLLGVQCWLVPFRNVSSLSRLQTQPLSFFKPVVPPKDCTANAIDIILFLTYFKCFCFSPLFCGLQRFRILNDLSFI